MLPNDFYKSVVLPNIADFEAEYGDGRKAFNAVAALDALAANLYNWCCSNAPNEVCSIVEDSHFRAELAKKNSDFALVRDIAKAQKHFQLQKPSQVSSASQIDAKSLGWGEARWGEGRFGGPPQIVVKTNSGEQRVLETLIKNARDFLVAEMRRVGVPE